MTGKELIMRKQRWISLIALLAVLLALAGCRNTPAATATPSLPAQTVQAAVSELQSVLADRMDGVNGKDQALYLSTVLPGDGVLMKEESNLIRAAGALDIRDYTISAADVTTTADGFTARLTQSYTLDGEEHACGYEAAFKTEGGKLYYCGPAFQLDEAERVKVWFTVQNAALAQQLLEAETAVLAGMKEHLGFVPNGFISIKLYDNQQVFLQSVKLDLPNWVGGWHEYGESIKSFTGAYGTEAALYKPMLNHETTHRMVSELSNDNASYWLQEGLASVFQNWLDDTASPFLTETELTGQYTPFAEHKIINLEQLDADDGGAVGLYYASSKAYAAFLLDRFGWDKMREALEYMKKFELIPVTGAEKLDEANTRTDEEIKTVFGFDTDGAFQVAFDEWRKSKS